MRRISTNDRYLALALKMREMALEAMLDRRPPEPWHARPILDGALSVLSFSDAPERAEVEVVIKADLGEAVRLNGPVYVNGFIEQGAAGIYEHALAQSRQILGDDHPATAYVLARKADMYLAQCRHWEAERVYLQVIEIIDRHPSPDPELLAHVLGKAAEMLDKTGREEQARGLRGRAEEIKATLPR
jgi:tetratricopeptide (TPR) repeat protein